MAPSYSGGSTGGPRAGRGQEVATVAEDISCRAQEARTMMIDNGEFNLRADHWSTRQGWANHGGVNEEERRGGAFGSSLKQIAPPPLERG